LVLGDLDNLKSKTYMRYLVKYKFYGKEKHLYKNFSNELERDRYKKWIKNQKGFSNVRLYINRGSLDEKVLIPKKKQPTL
jgi:hypothetical protein